MFVTIYETIWCHNKEDDNLNISQKLKERERERENDCDRRHHSTQLPYVRL
jgi:hypothetical protein